MAGEEGLEPSLPGPEPGVLPLDDSPATLAILTYATPFDNTLFRQRTCKGLVGQKKTSQLSILNTGWFTQIP